MVKKYMVRIIGALCILGAVVLMFAPAWLQMKDVDRGDLRDLRSDIDGVCTIVIEDFTNELENDDDFKDELRDYDLPYTRSKIKSRFRKVADLTDTVLDKDISLKEVLTLSVAIPGVLKDANNLLDSDCCETLFNSAAYYILYQGSQAIKDENGSNMAVNITYGAEQLEEMTQDTVDAVSEYSFAFVILSGVLILIIGIAVLSTITHVCNKWRWVKYVFLGILVVMVVGVCVALPAVSDMLADAEEMMHPAFADMSLKITVAPFFAIALMVVPVVLDIIYERKKETKLVEE